MMLILQYTNRLTFTKKDISTLLKELAYRQFLKIKQVHSPTYQSPRPGTHPQAAP